MMNIFPNKKVIVTGAGEGIGLGICRAFAERGAFVALNDVRADVARQMAEEMNEEQRMAWDEVYEPKNQQLLDENPTGEDLYRS